MLRLAVVALVLLGATGAHAAHRGRVFVDVDGDSHFGAGDRPLEGVEVFFELGAARTRSDRDGLFELPNLGRGLVWARVPEGFRPGPVWARVPSPKDLELPLRESPAPSPLRFVHGSDPHMDNAGEAAVASALAQALAAEPPPDFFTLTGDLASVSEPEEYAALKRILATTKVPFVPVSGNHDFHDTGVRYRAAFGPSFYAFDRGGVRFVVVDFNYEEADQRELVKAQLADWPADRPAVVLTHFTPSDGLAAAWGAAGVDAIFSGHHHGNYVIDRGQGLLEYKVEPLAMGGDYTPAGYRVVEHDARGFRVSHHTVVDKPVLELVFPPRACLPPGPMDLLASVELGQPDVVVRARVDGGEAFDLAPAGGWVWRGQKTFGLGLHRVRLEAVVHGQVRARKDVWTCAAGAPRPAAPLAPPLRPIWTQALGGHALLAAPVVAGSLAIAAVADLDDGAAGGLVAFDRATGAPRWQARVGRSVVTTPVVHGDRVTFLAEGGRLVTVGLDDGAPRWQADLGAGLDASLARSQSAPAVAGDLVVAALQQQLIAFDAATGAERWRFSAGGASFTTHHAAVVAAGDTVVAALGRAPVTLVALDLAGHERWRRDFAHPRLLEASPVVVDGKLYVLVVDGQLLCLDLASGRELWAKDIYKREDFVDWTVGPLAAPAIGEEMILVATPLRLRGIALGSHDTRWRLEPPSSLLRQRPLTAEAAGWLAPATLAGDVAWIGAGDGVLRALDPARGQRVWATSLGAPITGGVAVTGDTLLVAGYDGTLHAFVHDEDRPLPPRTGCSGSAAWLLLLYSMTMAKGRRAWGRPSAPKSSEPGRMRRRSLRMGNSARPVVSIDA